MADIIMIIISISISISISITSISDSMISDGTSSCPVRLQTGATEGNTILYHAILTLYSSIVYYTILCYTILYYTMLYYTILYYAILYSENNFAICFLLEIPLRGFPFHRAIFQTYIIHKHDTSYFQRISFEKESPSWGSQAGNISQTSCPADGIVTRV